MVLFSPERSKAGCTDEVKEKLPVTKTNFSKASSLNLFRIVHLLPLKSSIIVTSSQDGHGVSSVTLLTG